MKNQNILILLIAAVGGLVAYLLWRKNSTPAQATPRSSGSSAPGFAFVGNRQTPISGAPVPSLSNQLAQQGVNTLGNILSSLAKNIGGGGGGGGGFSAGGGSRSSSSGGSPSGGFNSTTTSSGATTFYGPSGGGTVTQAPGATLVQTNADFGQYFDNPQSADTSSSSADLGGELSAGQDSSSADLSSTDLGGELQTQDFNSGVDLSSGDAGYGD